jgi:hypothetical protein
MVRQTKTAATVKRLLGKTDEPAILKLETQGEIANALNWYQNNKDNKDAIRYIAEYLKKNKIKGRLDTNKTFSTVAFLCRIVSNGAVVSDEIRKSIDTRLREVITTTEPTKIVEDAPTKLVVSIQDRVAEKVSEIIGELEGSIDDLVLSGFKTEPSPYGIMHDKAKAMHAVKIIEWAKKRRQEFDEVVDTEDKELREGYSNFTKTQLKKIVSYCDTIITDAGKISGESKANRKPRKRKTKTPDQLVAKVKFCVESTEYKIKSELPKNIIGAIQIWVFNEKTRKLGVYNALDSEGFGVKGTSLTNFSEMKSVQKTLRKPEAILPDVVKGGKVFLRNAMDSVNAKATALTGRLNDDTLLVKIIK